MGETYYADNYEDLTGYKPGEEPETDAPGTLSTVTTKVVTPPEPPAPASTPGAETKTPGSNGGSDESDSNGGSSDETGSTGQHAATE